MALLPDPGSSQALLIGVHTYDGMENLPAVERNLTGLQQTLTDRDVWGLPPSHCMVLSQPSSTQAVLDNLGRVAANATDTLVVYYAGHGLTDPVSDELYLGLPGSDPERTYSALPYDWVRRAMLDPRVRARRKVMILDCCYSGRALLGGMNAATEVTSQVADHALIEGTCLLVASSATRKALSPPGEQYTAFTGELITLLTEGVSGGPPLLDMDTVYRQLYIALAARGRPLPQQRNRNTGGLVALARNRAHASAPLASPAALWPQPAEEPSSARPEPAQPRPAQPQAPRPQPAPQQAAPDAGQAARATASPPKASAEAPGGTSPETVRETARGSAAGSTRLVGPAAAPVPRRQGGRSVRVKATAIAAVIGLLAVGIPVTVTWLWPTTSDSSEDGTDGYNAASNGIVNASKTRGGTLKFVSRQDAASWDPQRGYYGYEWNFARYYTRQLVTYAPEPGAKSTRLMGDLATSTAKISDDRRTYTYRLRDGVTWEDGSEVTSADVKYGIERLWAKDVITGGPLYLQAVLDPDNTYKGPYKDTSTTGLKAIDTPDASTIVFHLPRPNGDFEQMLAMAAASPVKKEKDTKAQYGLRPFSNGPYRFKGYKPNKSMELVRNSHWNRASDPVRAALPERITVDFLSPGTDTDVMSKSLMDGEYDLELGGDGLSGAARAQALQEPKLKKNLDDLSNGFIRYAAFPQSVKPMDDIHCRRAVIYAADHKTLQTAFGGPVAGGDIAPSLLPPGVVGAEPTYDPYKVLKNGGKPDITKAEKELDLCGKPTGFSTTIAVRSDRPHDVSAATALQESLHRVGITAKIDQIDPAQSDTLLGTPAQVKAKGYGIIIYAWGSDFPSLQGFWPLLVDGRLIPASGNANLSQINTKAINKLLDSALTTSDSDRIAEISREINHQVSEGAYHLPFVYGRQLTWRGPRLTNVYRSQAYSGYDYASLGVTSS
ncbi:caspase, EACC1-associated type [Streptomyces olivaceoviridis]|uniref:caspase, EACC1-associated type n=1 Tax=Streptomyces olivaceoviridis TaxID=1921 RepID=UPI0037ADB212